jgi:hypothetical protein
MPSPEINARLVDARAFSAELPLAEESVALLTEKMSVPEFLDQLMVNQRWIDAVQVLARMMPSREAIWWASQCAANVCGPETRPQELQAVRAAETWVTDMSESTRYAAFEAAKQARLGSPANCVAMAAFVAGPSLAPRGSAPVAPAADLAAQMVAGTVMAAGYFEGYEQSAGKLRYFLEQGRALLQQLTTQKN